MYRRRLRRLFRRSPVPFWAVTLALALTTGLVVNRLVSVAEAEVARYGSLRTVPVVVRGVDAGAPVRDGDVELRRVPAAFVPAGEVAPATVGNVALVALLPGEVVLRSKLAPWGLQGAAALLPPGTSALAVPAGPAGRPPLRLLDRVDILATFDPTPEAPDGPPTFTVATGAVVVAVGDSDDGPLTVAVTPDEAPRLAFAITRGSVTVALTAPTDE